MRDEGDFSAKRSTSRAYSLLGIPERDGFLHDTCMTVSTAALCRLSKEKEVTVTGLLSSALIRAIATIQNERVDPSLHRPVRVQIPANLRKPFPSKTVRNFVAVVNVGLEKGELDADMEEILLRVRHQMALFLHPRNLRAVFTTNVKSEKGWGIRLVPLFLKNIVMRAVFDRVGEAGACLCLSNLGRIDFPEPLQQEVERVDFIIGPQCKAPYNCAVASFGEWTRIHVVRNSCEPVLEKRLYEVLTALGLEVTLESNGRD